MAATILDAHSLHRDIRLAGKVFAKLETAMTAVGPVNDDAAATASVARMPRQFNGTTGANKRRKTVSSSEQQHGL